MKKNVIVLILLAILISIAFSSSSLAADDLSNSTYAVEAIDGNSQVHIVDGSSENQMTNPTIQNAIDKANAGDTIEITGKSYSHCHFVIDKQLTITSKVGTTLSPCPSNTDGSGGIGIFYISPKASGTVLSGFTIVNDEFKVGTVDPYGIYINGASDVVVDNVTISKVSQGPGIYIKDSNNVEITNSQISNAQKGIFAENSTNLNIRYNNITSNSIAGIYIGDNVENVNIYSNMIQSNNYYGIYLASINNVNITNNRIEDNRDNANANRAGNGAGVYVDNIVNKLAIRGNFFSLNGMYGIYNSKKVTNIVDQYVEIIDGNYFIGHIERAVFHLSPTDGSDIVYVWSNYYARELFCGGTSYAPGELITNHERDLVMSPITEVRNGVYSVSFINPETGEVASSLSSITVIFYLNKMDNNPEPGSEDIFMEVPVINGTATVDFRNQTFWTSGNIIVAQGPGFGALNYQGKGDRPSQKYNVPDSNIPSNTTIYTVLTGEDVVAIIGTDAVYTVILKDEEGNPIANALVTFEFNNQITKVYTNSLGVATFTVNVKEAGQYVITASYEGEDDYSSAKTTNMINFVDDPKNQPTILVSQDLTKYFNEAGAYRVILTSNNSPLSNKTVTIVINGVAYKRTTDEKGVASININLNPGKYSVLVSFDGDDNYQASSCSGNIQVINSNKDLRDSTFISFENFEELFGENKKFEVLLSNDEGPLANQEILFEINGVTYSRTTDNEGKASIAIRLMSGTYNIGIKYLGNNLYQGTNGNGIIVIKNPTSKLNTQLISQDFSQYYGQNRMYSVQLVDENGNGLSNQDIVITVNGVSYTRTTDSNGFAKLTIRLSKGAYKVTSSYNGNSYFNSAKSVENNVIVNEASGKINTKISAENFNQLYGENKAYTIKLTDENGNPLSNQEISIKLNGVTYSRTTDENGIAKLTIRLMPGTYSVEVSYPGNMLYNPSNTINAIINVYSVRLVGEVSNAELQNILNSASAGEVIKLVNPVYDNISVTINKPIILISKNSAINGAYNKNVITVNADNAIISRLAISANNGNGIVVNGNDAVISECIIRNNLDSTLINQYNEGKVTMPGFGISISGSNNSKIINNTIYNYYNGINMENSNNIEILNNSISKNNFGIELGYNVTNTLIQYNNITDNIGLITLDVIEGPLGYGISLRHSGVNISILDNNINNNYMGIFIDAKDCTGIVIIGNSISNNTIEGITFNENYTYAENAVQPVVENNAIYNNAKGPSRIILGEVSANPNGIYGPGEWDDTLKLVLGSNWYGTNTYTTWGDNVTGAGTICPRISTDLITFNLSYAGNGKYNIEFYNNGKLATRLPEFTVYFTLNYQTDKQIEQLVTVRNGVATFSFPPENYYDANNIIEASSGSLFDMSRIFQVISTYNVPDSEIPI